jgi:peptidoglycan/xylan/chitin deacetylase (PgdA/CDA1 family)
MSRRSALYVVVIASLLTALMFPTTGVVEGATALPPRRTQLAVAAPTTTTSTTTAPRAARDWQLPPVENGLAPVVARVPTTEPVVFLGIDDGVHKAADELPMMQDNDVHASLFLANALIHRTPGFFAPFVSAGNLVEDHSMSHRLMPRLSYAEQVAEICGEADLQQQQFGRRPILFRPPGGAYNTDTRRAAAACGMRAVITWVATVEHAALQYQLARTLRPGDILLMHFRPEFRSDMQAFVDAMHAAGLHTELLEDWLPQPEHWMVRRDPS